MPPVPNNPSDETPTQPNRKDPKDPEVHKRRAQRAKAAHEKKMARATKEKGLLIVHTGNGKGKSSSAFGMGLRALGHGMKLGVVQFIKGALPAAERDVLAAMGDVRFETMGEGYTWDTQDRSRDIATTERAWAVVEEMLADPAYGMVILDELNIVLKYEYLALDRVLAACAGRPAMQHVVITGRNAPAELIEAADLVSEMKNIKHPYQSQGIKAQAGVEF